MRNFIASLVLFCLVAQPSWAGGRYGAEWTFTSQSMLKRVFKELQSNSWKTQLFGGYRPGYKALFQMRDKFISRIKKRCPECRVFPGKPNKIYLNDDFWVEINVDAAVIEVNTIPHDRELYNKNKIAVKKYVFDVAESLGLTAHANIGGGHVHMDYASHFGHDLLVLRNFVVDFMNHPELFMGILSHNYFYAPPLAVMGPESVERFKILLQEFDRGEIKNFTDFFERMNQVVYKNAYDFRLGLGGIGNANIAKHQLLNVEHEETFEVRGFAAQVSAEHYDLMLQLLEARLDYIKGFDRPINYIEKDFSQLINLKAEGASVYKSETSLPMDLRLQVFQKYLYEAGLSYEDYQGFVVDFEPQAIGLKQRLLSCFKLLRP